MTPPVPRDVLLKVRKLALLPEEVRKKIDVFPVGELGEALALTLRGASFREGRLLFGNEEPSGVVPLTPSFPH